MNLSAKDLKELLRYEDGKLFWKKRTKEQVLPRKNRNGDLMDHEVVTNNWNKRYQGKEAFTSMLRSRGGVLGGFRGRIYGRDYMKSTVVFAIMNGRFPADGSVIIYRDRDSGNCKIENLIECSAAEKTAYSRKRGGKDTGFIGVYYNTMGDEKYREKTNREKGEWLMFFNGKLRGRYKKPIEAAMAYDELAFNKYGELANLNIKR